jgi:threonine dehydrogenase-like Zn-dependent dehydrogenase
VAAAGLCGSDRELFAGTRPAGFAAYPVVPGHEWSGTVEAVGPGVDPGLTGAPVVGEGFRACRMCARCRNGRQNLCEAGYDETGFTRAGAFAEHLLIPAHLLHTLPPGTDLRAAALVEPAAVAAAAVHRAAPEPGDRVAVVGGGTLGLLAAQLLAASPVAELAVVEPRAAREPAARAAGATAFVPPGGAEGGFDVVIEAAGAPGTARSAVELARRGARVVLTGIPGVPDTLPVGELVGRALRLDTVFGAAPADWVRAVRALACGVLDPAPLIDGDLPLADYAAALERSAAPDAGKVLLRP